MTGWPVRVVAEAILRDMGAVIAATSDYSASNPPPVGTLMGYYGQPTVTAASAPPQIVWYAGDIGQTPPEHTVGDGAEVAWSAEPDVYFHIWGRDEDETWQIHRLLLLSARKTADYDVQWRGTRATRMLSGESDLGAAYLARLTLSTPIATDPLEPANVKAIGITGTAFIGETEYTAAKP